MTNQEIAKLLRNIATAYFIKDDKKYRFQTLAYQRAADAIESTSTQVKDLIQDDELEKLPGIGPSIQAHLLELIKTGTVEYFESILKDIPQAVFPLLDVPGFGPKKAYRLVTTFSLENPKTVIKDIEKIAKQGKIAPLDGFGEKSEQDILRGIAEFGKGVGKATRMALPYAAEIAEKLISYLKKSEEVIEAEPLGSLRRMRSTVGDIDMAVATKHPEKVIEHFIAYPYKDRIIEKGELGASLILSGGQQVDLLTQPPQRFGSLLQHFTGSKNHNIALRELALKKGYSLSERGMKKESRDGKEILEFKTEESFYKFLGMDWIPPEIREDKGEIERALKHDLPNLVELKDMKGDLHIHSAYPIEPSHDMGQTSMEDMLVKAKRLGYEYLGFSEHNPNLSKHSKSDIYSIMAKRKDKIEHISLSKKYIRVINLLETDILPSGELAMDDKALEYVDGTIVSIHSNFGMDMNKMTRRVLKGLSHPKAKILAHPTGRLINSRNGYELDWEKIFEFASANDKAIEINSFPERLDLPDTLIYEAIKYGVKFVINTDSHHEKHMDLMKYGVSVARRGWAQKHDILNTLSYNDFITWLNK